MPSQVHGHFLCQHTHGRGSQVPCLSMGVPIHCFLNCLVTLEETPYAADALSEDKWWVVSPSCRGWTMSLADAVLSAKGELRCSVGTASSRTTGRTLQSWEGVWWESCGATAHPGSRVSALEQVKRCRPPIPCCPPQHGQLVHCCPLWISPTRPKPCSRAPDSE